MTGRELIRAICETTENLDAVLTVKIVHRDSNMCVTQYQIAAAIFFINGKLSIEGGGLSDRKPAT